VVGYSLIVLLSLGCGDATSSSGEASSKKAQHSKGNGKEIAKRSMDEKHEVRLATFGSGCFWCTEAMFERLEGVEKVVSGYSGGHVNNPTYEQVCAGATGHAESIEITYRPDKVTYSKLLEVFWRTHDPTTKNRQGNDVGTQYRSVVFYHDEEQRKLAETYRNKLESEHIWDRPIVTEIVPFVRFWPAEEYHQNYYDNNPTKGYCSLVITPKIEKFRKIFKDQLKPQR
jgi:peptide-methionine (S)-S-oxide reductase